MAVDDSRGSQSTSQTHVSHKSKPKESDPRPELDDEKKLPPEQVQQPLMYHDDDGGKDDDGDGLLSIGSDADQQIALDHLLLSHQIEGMNGESYWTRRLLRQVITEARLSNKLERQQIKCPLHARQLRQNYISVVAILILMDELQRIDDFVRCGVRDDVLPLDCIQRDGIYHVTVPADPSIPLECFSKLKPFAHEQFMDIQRRVTVPFFDLKEDGTCKEYELRSDSIRPWSYVDNLETLDYEQYVIVRHVMMHPTCHGFGDTLQKAGVFTIRTLEPRLGEKIYKNELARLRSCGRYKHNHLIATLAALRYHGEFSFLFPKAETTLGELMQHAQPSHSWDTMRWASEQLAGLASALSIIHGPLSVSPRFSGMKKKYGRRGGIDFSQILCFRSTQHANHILVIYDFGLSTVDHEAMEYDTNSWGIDKALEYRPPECDIEGETDSGPCDVWALGCLYLDFLTWLLGGPQLLAEFRRYRTTFNLNGTRTDVFFELLKKQRDNNPYAPYAVQVKSKVAEWIYRLRHHERTTQFVQDMLSIIEGRMLVVIGNGNARAAPGSLKNLFEDIALRCKAESYCMDRVFFPDEGVHLELPVEVRPSGKTEMTTLFDQRSVSECSEDTVSAALKPISSDIEHVSSLSTGSMTKNSERKLDTVVEPIICDTGDITPQILGETVSNRGNILDNGEKPVVGDMDDAASQTTDGSTDISSNTLGSVVESILSDKDDISSQTSQRTMDEAQTGKALIRVFLAEEPEFRGICDVAIPALGRSRFVVNLRRLLKRFHLDLLNEARDGTEKTVAKLLRSRRGREKIGGNLFDQINQGKEETKRLPLDLKIKFTSKQRVEDWVKTQGQNREIPSDTEQGSAMNDGGDAPMKLHDEAPLKSHDGTPMEFHDEAPLESHDDTPMELHDNESSASSNASYSSQGQEIFPFTEMLKEFLRQSASFQNLKRDFALMFLPVDVKDIFLSVPKGGIRVLHKEHVSTSDKFKSFVENQTSVHWHWWPLQPRISVLPPGKVRISWDCDCGLEHWHDVSTRHSSLLESILNYLDDKPNPANLHIRRCRVPFATRLGNLLQCFFPNSMSPATSMIQTNISLGSRALRSSSAAAPSLGGNRVLGSGASATNQTSQTQNPSSSQQNQTYVVNIPTVPDKWILFGVRGASGIMKPAEVSVGTQTTDYQVFQNLWTCYCSQRGLLRLWFSIWTWEYCEGVKFERTSLARMVRLDRELPIDRDYEYAPRAPGAKNPPIRESIWHDYFISCPPHCKSLIPHSCVLASDRRHNFDKVPKRETKFEGDKSDYIWGLEAVFAVSAFRVLAYHCVILAGPFVFWGVWLKYHPDDVQSAAVPITVVIALVSLFWSAAGILPHKRHI